jgi:hypothetical protein
MSKTIALEIVPKDSKAALAAKLPEFNQARAYAGEIVNLGHRANLVSILLGDELNRLKKQLGRGHGGARKSSSQTANLLPWEDLVKAQTGLSYDTCQRCMKLAEAAKSKIKILGAEDVIKTPFSALPEARQKEVAKAIQRVVDGQTMTQLMFDFGVLKPRAKNHPPAGGKSPKNDFKGGAHNRSDEVTPEMYQESAKEHLEQLAEMKATNAWKFLEDGDLSALLNHLDTWLTEARGLLKDRKQQALKRKK